MQLWTFGLILLLLLSTWTSLSTADDREDDEANSDEDEPEYDDEEENDSCTILKEKVCRGNSGKGKRKGKGQKPNCSEQTKFNCSPTCGLYTRSTTTESSKPFTTTIIYICLISAISPTRPIPISSTVSKISITPSFPTSSIITDSSGSGSGDEDEDEHDSKSPRLSTVTNWPLSSVVPSFTVQFPSSFPSTATSTLSAESCVLSIFPSPTLRTAAPSSKGGDDDDDDDECNDDNDDNHDDDGDGDDDNNDDDNDDDGDGDDNNDDDNDDEGDDNGKSGPYVSVGTSIITKKQNGTRNLKKFLIRTRESPTKQKNSCKKSSVIRSTKLLYSLTKTTQKQILCSTPPRVIATTNRSRSFQLTTTSLIKTTQEHLSSGTPSKIFTMTNSSGPVRPSSTSYNILLSVTSSVLPRTDTSTVMLKPDSSGAEISTRTISLSTSASFFLTSTTRPETNGTKMTTKVIFPSTFGPMSSSYAASTTPSLSFSIISEPSSSIAPTPVLSSSPWEYSKTVLSVISSSNVTLDPSTITPTMTSTVMVSSSILTQQPTVYCSETKTGDKFDKGVLVWQKTLVGSRANTSCPYNKTAIAYRWCRIANKTQYWEDVHDENCSVLEKQPIDELINEDITEENEEEIAVLMNYYTSTSNATVDLVKDSAQLLEKLITGATNLTKISKELLSSVSNVMNADPTVLAQASKKHNSTNKILSYIEKLMDDISLGGKTFVRENLTNLVAEAWDVANKTDDLIFETISEDKDGDNSSLVSVKVPRSLLRRYKEKQRITFINFLNDNLFPQDGDMTKKFINSKIVSVSIKGEKVKNLSDPVVMEFEITNKSYAKNCSCVFWDFEADGGLGRWSSNGCVYEIIGDGRSRCSCSHLTHFGILVDLFPNEEIGDTDQLILEGITFVGCYLSIVGLVLTIITLLSFKQYRNGVSGQILLNLCLALLFSLIVFLSGIKQVDDESTCVTMAALLHYFVLVAVLWMGFEAFHMFVNIVLDSPHGERGKTFVLKCAAVAWVLPMVIVVISVLINSENYKNEKYCRVAGTTFYIAFLVPALAVMLFNVIIFLLVVKALQNTRFPSNRHKQGIVHFRRVLGIAIVFGITWLFGILAIGELKLIFQYLFCITNAFQGFIIFILYCLTDRKVREKLVRFLCALPDPNKNNRVLESTSTQRTTDIELDLEMFRERVPSTRPRNWSGTWPMSGGHLNSTRITSEEVKDPVILYPPLGYSPHMTHYNTSMVGPSYDRNMLQPSFDSNLVSSRFHSQSVDPDYALNPEWEFERDTADEPYNYRNPPGSRPVTHVHLPGDSGDKLVDSTISQLERSGGEVSLQSANSILFINDGRRVEVPKHHEFSGNNNNWERTIMEPMDDPKTGEFSLEGPRRYSQGEDGLSFYRKPKKQRHSSATTSDELNKRIICPKGKSLRDKGVHFSADQLTNSPKKCERWSEMPAFPRLKTLPRQEDISETDEIDGEPRMRMSRGEHEPGMGISHLEHAQRRTRSARPSRAIDDDLEEEYLRNYGKTFEHEEEHISSNFIAASELKNSRGERIFVRPEKEVPTECEIDFSKSRQSSASSGSETSNNTRWSQVGQTPNLKSKSQTTFSDLGSNDDLGDGDGSHFTQF